MRRFQRIALRAAFWGWAVWSLGGIVFWQIVGGAIFPNWLWPPEKDPKPRPPHPDEESYGYVCRRKDMNS